MYLLEKYFSDRKCSYISANLNTLSKRQMLWEKMHLWQSDLHGRRDTLPQKMPGLYLMQSLKVKAWGCCNQNWNLHFNFFTSALFKHVKSLGCPLILMYYMKMTSIKRPCNFLPSTLFSLPIRVGNVPLWIATDYTLVSLLRYFQIFHGCLYNQLPWERRWQERTKLNSEESFISNLLRSAKQHY